MVVYMIRGSCYLPCLTGSITFASMPQGRVGMLLTSLSHGASLGLLDVVLANFGPTMTCRYDVLATCFKCRPDIWQHCPSLGPNNVVLFLSAANMPSCTYVGISTQSTIVICIYAQVGK